MVAGFSFAAKAWGVAMVDGLRAASFNDRAFEQLVLPPARKRLIEALVLSHGDEGREGGTGVLGFLSLNPEEAAGEGVTEGARAQSVTSE